MSVPALRFKEFSQTLTPENFGHVISANKYGPRFDASDYDTNGNVKTIRGTDVSLDGEIKYSQVPRAKLDENFIKDNLLNDGDLIMITTADCGLTGVFRKQEIEYIPSAYAVKIELNELGFPYYFKYYFQTKRVKDEINKYVRKGTVANLPLSDIGKISIKLPNIVEQTKIANFLTAIDEKISHLTQKHDLLTQYKKGVMQQIFSQELRFKDDDGRDFPDWEETALENCASFYRGGSLSKSDIDINGKFSCVHYGELFTTYNEIITTVKSKTNITNTFNSEFGDILMPSSDVTPAGLAKASCILKAGVVLGGDINVIRVKNTIAPTFLSYLLNFEKNKIIQLVSGTTVKHIYIKDIKSIELSIPTVIAEQTKIANFLTAIDDKISVTKTQLQAVKQYKQGLLQQMFV